ncbi:MAG: sensor histidine kinase, partial [Chloroflexi bacterium]|nr:sensor histidine kinase [Chloroflexota bacterium]
AVLEVQDAGQGIATADLPHLFSRFYQVERPDRPSRGGLGLGLYLVQELVEAHQGTVMVASVVGQGTTFTVRLPLAGARDIPAPWDAPAGLGGAKEKEDETDD